MRPWPADAESLRDTEPAPRARFPRTWAWLAGWLVLLSATGVRADTVVSRSGQFLIHSSHPTAPSLSLVALPDDTGRVLLQAPTLAVSCERIKAALLAELGLSDQWRGQVQVRLINATASDQMPRISARHFADGWRYFVVTPDELQPVELVRAVVTTLLLEMANRFPGPHPATVPYWLSEGLTAGVRSRVGPALVVGGSRMVARVNGAFGELAPDVRERVYGDALTNARRLIREQPPLSFEDLSLPRPGALRGAQGALYRASALAFLTKLRQLPQGDARLKQMLTHLTANLNWQTTFLQAFQPHFGSLLEVEKWWALARVRFVGEGVAVAWTPTEAMVALARLLTVTITTRTGPGAPLRREPISLQQALQRLALADFVATARLKQRQLAALAARLPGEVGVLGREYRTLLERYLQAALQDSARTGGRLVINRRQHATLRELTRLLDRLDRRRAALQGRLAAQATANK